MKIYQFEAKMLSDDTHDWGYIEFPYDVQQEFGVKGQVKVLATFDGYEYRGSLVKMGRQCHFIGITQPIRSIIGKNPGDMVLVTIQQDVAPRMVEVPEDFQKLLLGNHDARAFFDTLSFSNRKEYVQWITSAKKTETREKRLTESIVKLKGKVKHP